MSDETLKYVNKVWSVAATMIICTLTICVTIYNCIDRLHSSVLLDAIRRLSQ